MRQVREQVAQVRLRAAAGHRTVSLPRFAANVLLRRAVVEETNNRDLEFPSSAGTLREVNNVERQWRVAGRIVAWIRR